MGSPLDDVKKTLVTWLLRQVSNLFEQIIWERVVCYFRYESNFEELEQYVEDLRQKKDTVERHVEAESKNYSKNIAADVETWLQQVKNIITEHEVFLEDEALPYTVCSKGFLPRHGIRYRLARTADRLARKVDKLHKTSNFDRFSDGLVPISIDFILSDIGFESFESRNAVMKKIMEALKDSTVRRIGVCGPGGVGKTTLAKKVAREARKDKLFNVVVVANVTRNPDTRKIQGQLADMMGLRLEEESEIGRASRLRDRFKKEKESTLVILDDLWAGLDLIKLGIPIDENNSGPSTVKDTFDSKISTGKSTGDSRMVKILLTSRSKEVLSSKMDVKEKSVFSIEGLLDKEAEILFKKEARVCDKTAVFEPLATQISKKCAGLPMAVVTIGRALRDKKYPEWNDALRQLERREFTEVGESVEFSTKLSFDHLENEELKSTFLLCAQMGHHPLIMDLVKFCIGLGIFEGFFTIREARERIHTLIGKLKDSSLLMNSYSSDRFSMHDMIRDVALSIASKERHVFTMRNGKLDEWPYNAKFERYSVISIHNCDINDELPESVSCPRLKIFHVDGLHSSFNIPHNFFSEMEELRALILTGIDLSLLPASIRCLRNLRMLCLEQCVLGDISFIGELQKLRILSLSGSKFENLPSELGQLCKLQLFDISNCSELKDIPPNVLSRLNNLEELYMRNSVKWENEGTRSGNAILAELRHLHELKNLDICIPNAACLPRNLFLDKLDRYKIVIGGFETLSVGDFKMPDKYEASRVLALQIKESDLIHSQKGIKMLFSRVEKMLLGELKGVQNIFYELNLEGFPRLKHLSIASNSDIECIIDSKELSDPKDVFLNLESLCLYNLRNLKKISYSKLAGTSFSKLKVVRINVCAQLKNIFSLSMVLLLTNLETIDVSNCDFMEKIVAEEEGDMDVKDDQIFPKLRSLALQTLPKLSGVYSNEQGESTDICLFSEQVAMPNLESLELFSISIHKIWSSRSKPFKNLISLNVQDCNEIEYLLSFSMARGLVNLKSMSVSGCEKIGEIFKSERIIVHEARKICLFPKLEEIHLSHMKNLTSLWPIQVSRESFPSLNSVFIVGCEKLVTVFPSHMVGRFGSLERLNIVNCDLVEVIFELKNAPQNSGGDETHLRFFHINALPKLKHVWNRDPEGILNFRSLHIIVVYGCHDLKYLFPVSVVKGLRELDSLSVVDCPHMEEIARGEESNASSITFVFPKVTHVAIVALPELKSFYKGRHSLKWPKLKKLGVNNCDKLEVFKTETTNSEGRPVFLPEEIISNLEEMSITLKDAERLKHRIKDYCMYCLNSFVLTSCPSVEFLHWFIHRMPYLERLILIECDLREVIPRERLGTQAKIGTVVQLKYLWLMRLHVLENIGFERDPVLQRLEDLYLHGCHKLINLVPSSVTLTHLTSLVVHHCQGLRNLVGFSTANSLAQLMSLKVIGCKMLEEIVAEQNEEEDKITKDHEIVEIVEIVFRKLMTLELVSLPKLSCFCSSENHAFKFPSLEKLILGDCSMMTKFSKRFTTAPNLQVLERRGEWYRNWKGDLKATIQTLFANTLPFKCLWQLELSGYAELEEIWRGKILLPDNSFQNLRTLVVENCEFLSNVIASNLLPYLENLEELQVRACRSVVAIFDINDKVKVKSHLKKLTLDRLPNTKHVWNKNPQRILSFENLQEVQVTDCESLQTLFPAVSFAKNLLELETLEIRNCGALVEIVGKVDASAEGAIEEIEFRRLTSMTLNMLPKLKYFYPGRMKLRCPDLKILIVRHCGKLQIFTSESQSYQEALAEDQIGLSIDSQSLFSIQEAISCQGELSLNNEEAMMLCNVDIPVDLVDKIKCLQLHFFRGVSLADELPYGILHKLPNIETLAVVRSYFKEIFPQTLELEFARLRGLRLEVLSYLNCIGLEHSCMDPLRENLEILEVRGCPCLTKLVQSTVSFSNLQELVISGCHRLEYLFRTRTARSLVQLKRLSVENCESIEKIVTQEEDGIDHTDDNITFGELREVFLNSLPRLACICKGYLTMEFPNLEELIIAQCANIKFFSQGCVSVRHSSFFRELDSLFLHLSKKGILRSSRNTNMKIFSQGSTSA